MNEIENISRRDFLKLKFLLMFYTYFSQFFGVNLMAETTSSKIDYSILDKLLKIPFSQVVKDEIKLRVELQKKYCLDTNGNLYTLNRFLKETINFVVSNGNFHDFKILNSLKDKQIDYGYMLNSTAKHNQVESMNYMQQKLLGNSSNDMLNDAILYAIKSNSLDTTIHLMQQNIKLDEKIVDEAITIFQREENDIFFKKLRGSNDTKLLPFIGETKKLKKRRKSKLYVAKSHFFVSTDELRDISYNSLVDMYNLYYIDDFTAEAYKDKLEIQVWNHNNTYIVNFFKEFENLLLINGFEDFKEVFLNQDEYDMQVSAEFKRDKNKDIEYYDFMNIEVL